MVGGSPSTNLGTQCTSAALSCRPTRPAARQYPSAAVIEAARQMRTIRAQSVPITYTIVLTDQGILD
jgi:hypothetical protein